MGIVEELWRENTNFLNNALKETTESKQLWAMIETNRSKLENKLDDSGKEVLDALMDCVDELSSLNERRVFTYAFRLGTQLMAECLTEEYRALILSSEIFFPSII